jgi:CBF/Mak21 family
MSMCASLVFACDIELFVRTASLEASQGDRPTLLAVRFLQVFTAKYRLKFLQLADVFLASSLVPAYTIAAFAKRFARIALAAPPMGAIVCVAFVHNLLRRHPSCTCLLHQPGAAASTAAAADAAPSTDATGAVATDGCARAGALGEGPGVDVYDAEAEDPVESRAIESSLWELAALRCHQVPMVRATVRLKRPCCRAVGDGTCCEQRKRSPIRMLSPTDTCASNSQESLLVPHSVHALAVQVSKFVEQLDRDLTDRKKTAEVDMAPLLPEGYSSQLRTELARKLRAAPATAYVQPQGLFDGGMPGCRQEG